MTHTLDPEKAGELANSTASNRLDGDQTESEKQLSPDTPERRSNDASREERGEGYESSSSAGGEEFEVKWDGPNDPGCPKSMSKTKKWICTWVVSLGSLCV